MIVAGQAISGAFATRDATGELAALVPAPAGLLYVNGVPTGDAVTIAGANPYSWAVTLPALAAGDHVQVYITAGGTGAFVWTDCVAPAGMIADISASVWTYVSRTLTVPITVIQNPIVIGTGLNPVKALTFDALISGLTIPAGWTAVELTAKRTVKDTDSGAILQLKVSNPGVGTDGVLVVERVAATVAQRTQGSLVVNQPGGSVTVHLQDDLTAELTEIEDDENAGFDIKIFYTSGGETMSLSYRGEWTMGNTETQSLS